MIHRRGENLYFFVSEERHLGEQISQIIRNRPNDLPVEQIEAHSRRR